MVLEGLHRAQQRPSVSALSFWTIYPLSVIYIFHSLMVAYINSTYMEQYISPSGVGLLFTVGSLLAIAAFLLFNPTLQKLGNTRLTVILAMLDIGALITLGSASNAYVAITSFLVFLAVNPLLFLNIDIYAESIIGDDEGSTGSKRGLTLTLMSIASVFAPLLMGYISEATNSLSYVYYASALIFCTFVGFILFRFRGFVDPTYERLQLRHTLKKISSSKDIKIVFTAQFLLQMFFAWMVIYVPLYLTTQIGMSWESIGSILAVAMIAYVVLEFPVGFIADRYIGEKEMMALGFLVLAVSSSWIAFVPAVAGVGIWMLVMFTTRVGAALVEVTSESYFFKHTKGSDADLINSFRVLRPFANLVGALIGSISIALFPFSFTFILLGVMMIPGLILTMFLNDTK